MLRSPLLVLLLSFSWSLHAMEIYRWTDDAGRVHYSDQVPRKHKDSAKRIDPNLSEVHGGAKRVERAVVPSVPPLASDQADAMPASAGSSGASGTDDCDTLRRRYWESQACFNRFRNANGSVKPDAYRYCTEVQNPVRQCGPLILEP